MTAAITRAHAHFRLSDNDAGYITIAETTLRGFQQIGTKSTAVAKVESHAGSVHGPARFYVCNQRRRNANWPPETHNFGPVRTTLTARLTHLTTLPRDHANKLMTGI